MNPDVIRVAVAEDHRIVREGLLSLLRQQPGIEVVGEAENGAEAVEIARTVRPDIIIMDLSMPGMNGIDATRMITKEAAGVKIIALSMHSDKRFVVEMLRAGASGYLLKDCAVEELARAIQTVREDHRYVSPEIVGIVVEDYISHLEKPLLPQSGNLTAKERQVLGMIADGLTTKKIASELNISDKTVETHRQHIMEKLNIHNIADLTKYAIREGIILLGP